MNHENDPGVGPLLERATADLPVDAHRLVATSMTRGRTLRRRHQAGTAVAALAVFGVVGALATVVPTLGDSPQQAPPFAGDPTPSGSAGASPSGVPARQFGPDPARMAAVLESLLPPGAVTRPEVWHGGGARGFQAGQLLLDGARVTVLLEARPGSEVRCGEQPPGASCTSLGNGDWSWSFRSEESEQNQPNGIRANGVGVATEDGFNVTVTAYNAADEKYADPISPDPVLTLAQLKEIALDPVWLEDRQ